MMTNKEESPIGMPEKLAAQASKIEPIPSAAPYEGSKPILHPDLEAAIKQVDCSWNQEMPLESGNKKGFSYEQPVEGCDIVVPALPAMPLESDPIAR